MKHYRVCREVVDLVFNLQFTPEASVESRGKRSVPSHTKRVYRAAAAQGELQRPRWFGVHLKKTPAKQPVSQSIVVCKKGR